MGGEKTSLDVAMEVVRKKKAPAAVVFAVAFGTVSVALGNYRVGIVAPVAAAVVHVARYMDSLAV